MDDIQQGEQELPKPEKRTFWRQLGGGALSIAVIIHVILAIGGGIWIAQRIFEPEKKVDFLPGGGNAGGGERGAQTKVQQKKRAQITPTTNVKRVFAEGASSTFSIPDPGDNFGEMSTLSSLAGGGMSGGLGGSGSGGGFGSGTGSGTGLGMGGAGVGKLFGLIPESMRKRCSKEDRLSRLKENGGTPECEEAVKKGLQWLKANQNADGSWSTKSKGTANKSAMTGLALLAYFGHCETPMSEEFGESCLKGIVYLVNVGVKNKGVLVANVASGTQPVYEHAIATYALGEAATFCKELKIEIPNLMEVTRLAGQFIIDNQADNGGWAYGYKIKGGHTDSSIVGWQLQALKACSHAKIQYKGLDSSVKKGLAYLATLQSENGGFGYNGKGAKPGLTGVGVLCFQMWDKGKSPEVRNGLKYLKENSKLDWKTANADLYAHYYISQAMMQAGGSNWTSYNSFFRDQLLSNQNPDGSWKAPPLFAAHGQSPGNDVYINTLCILMLEVYYRFLSTGGGGGGRNERPGI
jgi:hypothetical protein